jgi:RHS repeat-associated protein
LACNAPLTYTGHLYDPETGLFYFGARYYDPDTGRFLTHDPVAGDALNPPSLHKYLYAYSSPMTFTDPWGEKVGDWWDPKTYLGGRAKGTFGAAMSRNGTVILTDPGNHRVLRIPRKVAEEHSADLYYALVGTGAMDVQGAMNFMGKNGLLPSRGTKAYNRIVFGTAGNIAHAYLKLQAQIDLAFASFVATEGFGGSALERVIANPEVRGAIASGLGGSTAQATADVANGHAPSLKRMAIAALTAGGARYVAGATGVIKLESGTQEVEQGAEKALESDSALSSRQYISNSTTAGAKEAYAAEQTAMAANEFSYEVNSLPSDLAADPRGVYGYLPKEGTEFAPRKWPVDWTDPDEVASARAARLEYHKGLAAKRDWVQAMRAEGATEEDVARGLVEMRNQDRLATYSQEQLPAIYERNQGRYLNPFGPSYEYQLQRYKTPEMVVEAALRTNKSFDILTGIAKVK